MSELAFQIQKQERWPFIDTRTNKHIGDIKTDVHPGGVKNIEKSGPRIFVTLSAVPKLGVIDRKKREEITRATSSRLIDPELF